MGKEGQPIEPESNKDRHEIVLGVPFKPFRGVRRYQTPSGGDLVVPESYPYYLYLRRNVSLSGIDGVVDVIEDDPKNFISKIAVMASPYRLFSDYPLGRFLPTIKYRGNNQYEPVVISTCLRFSFLVKTPRDYAKLLSTYADVNLGKEKFLLIFNLNQQSIKRGFQWLEEGKELLVIEYNLLNYKEVEEISKEPAGNPETDQVKTKKDQGDPGRIAFVHLPDNLRKLRTTEVVFNRIDPWGDREYPPEPVQSNLQPIPILA